MPSLSSLFKHAKRDGQDRNVIANLEDESSEKLQRRHSKRDFLKSLLKRSSIQSNQSHRMSDRFTTTPSASPDNPAKVMSNPNKPLPRPPLAGAQSSRPTKPAIKLERIITPISTPDLHKLFSGAPQFLTHSEGHHAGAPYPSVAFPWNSEVEILDLSDHVRIADAAWGSMTVWPHVTKDVRRNAEAVERHQEKQKAHFLPRCRERPNMLSMQGSERGTIGFAAALELEIADALNGPEEETSDEGPDSLPWRRRKFLNRKDGLRPITESTLIDCLIDVSTIYHDDPGKNERSTVEMYTRLFTQILFPPSRVTDSDDPYSLLVQIEVLIEVLAAPNIWVDFSLVEWRIRLGQILWGPVHESDPDDDISINSEVIHEPGAQKYWLLLQILIAAELLVRLDAIAHNADSGSDIPTPAETDYFEKTTTSSVNWSLILARIWLENIRVEKAELNVPSEQKSSPSWLAKLTGTTGPPAPEEESMLADNIHNYVFQGRHQVRQVSGLLHFANTLHWPNIEKLAAKVSASNITMSDNRSSTPGLATPLSLDAQQSGSYFGRRPGMRRGLSALIHPSGWLSNTYISGLIMPGEALSHFLISTLLENDDAAFSKLGIEANLYGGFVYSGKSFWSLNCIVGRVLAAGKGASECVGWVSSGIIPTKFSHGWVDIKAEKIVSGRDDKGRPRLLQNEGIGHDNSVIAGVDTSSVLPGDFTIPSDEPSDEFLSIILKSLDLFAKEESVPVTPTREIPTPTPLTESSEVPIIRTYSSSISFSISVGEAEEKQVTFNLKYDVNFVTGHPCVPSRPEISSGATSPELHGPKYIRQISKGHPLHKGYSYLQIPLSKILSSPEIPLSELLASRNLSDHASTTSTIIPKVLVINCTDPKVDDPPTHHHNIGCDQEILLRALCSERGWNALISRRASIMDGSGFVSESFQWGFARLKRWDFGSRNARALLNSQKKSRGLLLWCPVEDNSITELKKTGAKIFLIDYLDGNKIAEAARELWEALKVGLAWKHHQNRIQLPRNPSSFQFVVALDRRCFTLSDLNFNLTLDLTFESEAASLFSCMIYHVEILRAAKKDHDSFRIWELTIRDHQAWGLLSVVNREDTVEVFCFGSPLVLTRKKDFKKAAETCCAIELGFSGISGIIRPDMLKRLEALAMIIDSLSCKPKSISSAPTAEPSLNTTGLNANTRIDETNTNSTGDISQVLSSTHGSVVALTDLEHTAEAVVLGVNAAGAALGGVCRHRSDEHAEALKAAPALSVIGLKIALLLNYTAKNRGVYASTMTRLETYVVIFKHPQVAVLPRCHSPVRAPWASTQLWADDRWLSRTEGGSGKAASPMAFLLGPMRANLKPQESFLSADLLVRRLQTVNTTLETEGAWTRVFSKKVQTLIGPASLASSAYDGLHSVLAVPSRIYTPPSTEKLLNGVRVAVKDIVHVRDIVTTLGGREYTSDDLKHLINLGVMLVGKTLKSAFTGSEVPPDKCIDYFQPWNPRADGYQGPPRRSSGAGSTIADYDWLDVTLASDNVERTEVSLSELWYDFGPEDLRKILFAEYKKDYNKNVYVSAWPRPGGESLL
ncbi:hypothetical protein B7494_g2965 [Chlorociboria aeruginascens]|nr:hypothetical protein B7494_g2965 [Chlorociboria aeruginascens]